MMKNYINNEEILIGDKLQSIRKSLGLSQEEVAESIELSPRYISDLERNKAKGSISTLIKLCNFYKISPTFLLKDYLNIDDYKLDNKLTGFSSLNKNEKNIIKKLIYLMSQNKK